MERLNKRICKKCKSIRIAIDGDYVGTTYFKCETCGYVGDSDNFPKITNGDFIRQMSDEELAEMLVYEQVVIKNIQINDSDSSHNEGTYMKMWKSALLPTKFFDDKQKVLEVTLEELRRKMHKNKICGGCRYFDEEVSHCERFECGTREHYVACDAFNPIEESEVKDE